MPDPGLALLIALAALGGSALLFWPAHGVYWRWRQARRVTERVLIEDALKHLYAAQVHHRPATVQSLAGALQISGNHTARVIQAMTDHRLAEIAAEGLHLTPEGQEYALHMVRSHRLWERYLADRTGFAEGQWHDRAEEMEHVLSPDEADLLATQLGNPIYDPHGDPIPLPSGEIKPHGGQPLTAMAPYQTVRIVHLEDEPQSAYAQLVAEGLYPGMEAYVLEVSPQRVRLWADGDEHLLAPMVAANISVKSTPTSPATAAASENLAGLKPGERAAVVGISPRCRGPERRRLLDMGVLPGTIVQAEFTSAGGDPTAYLVRGALLALRAEQAQLIYVNRVSP